MQYLGSKYNDVVCKHVVARAVYAVDTKQRIHITRPGKNTN